MTVNVVGVCMLIYVPKWYMFEARRAVSNKRNRPLKLSLFLLAGFYKQNPRLYCIKINDIRPMR